MSSSGHLLSDLDSFLPQLTVSDPRTKLVIGAKLHEYLSDPSNSIVCSDIGYLVDSLVSWLQCSNFKVVQLDLDILGELIQRMNVDFQPYASSAIPNLIDKLGDTKDVIREKTLKLFVKLVECDVITAQGLFDKMAAASCFSHKNSNVREQAMRLLVDILDRYGASALIVSKLLPSIIKLLADPNVAVRSTAFDTVCDIYKHVGEKVRNDLQRKYAVPNNKLPLLLAKFDEIKAATSTNSLFSSMTLNGGDNGGHDDEDELDRREDRLPFETMVEVSAYRPPITPAGVGSLSWSSCGTKRTQQRTASKAGVATPAGTVTEETFVDSFEAVPPVQVFCGKEVEDCLHKYDAVVQNVNEDWSKRVDCLKRIRSLVMAAGRIEYDEFHLNLGSMLPAFLTSLKDLRSQVIREACITIAYLSVMLADKFDRFAESVLAGLINLLQNSAKVVSSSSLVCIRFVLRHTHSPRLIPVIVGHLLSSKSKDIRRACCEFVYLILGGWSPSVVEKHVSGIQQAIKKGIADADAEARLHSRNAFAEFARHFPQSAEMLKNSLDFAYRKQLSSTSGRGAAAPSNSSLSSSTSLTSRTPSAASRGSNLLASSAASSMNRSSSAIDPRAAKRAKTRAQYATIDRQKLANVCGMTLLQRKNGWGAQCMLEQQQQQHQQQQHHQQFYHNHQHHPHQSRTTNRASLSQPTSRSASPSSAKLSYSQLVDGTVITPRLRRSSADHDDGRNCSSSNCSLGRYGSGSGGGNGSCGFKSHLPVRRTSPSPSKDDLLAETASSAAAAAFGVDRSTKQQLQLMNTNSNNSSSNNRLEDHECMSADKDSTSYDSGISQTSSSGGGRDIKNYVFPDTQQDCDKLKVYIDELSAAADDAAKIERLSKIKTLVQESPSDILITHFKLILGKIIGLIAESQPAAIKELSLQLLQTIVKRKTVTFLLKQFSDLIIIRVIAVCGDAAKEVAKAAENCAITLSTHLPLEAVVRVIVPLITSETTSVRLVAIKMLNRLIECSDECVTAAHVDQIMPVLLVAYDDPESAIRKGAVFCIVALHKQSEEMKIMLQPYINHLQGGKLKLLQLYIRKAEQGSSMPTSPRNV